MGDSIVTAVVWFHTGARSRTSQHALNTDHGERALLLVFRTCCLTQNISHTTHVAEQTSLVRLQRSFCLGKDPTSRQRELYESQPVSAIDLFIAHVQIATIVDLGLVNETLTTYLWRHQAPYGSTLGTWPFAAENSQEEGAEQTCSTTCIFPLSCVILRRTFSCKKIPSLRAY